MGGKFVNSEYFRIAIDGPSGVGKSSAAKMIAEALNFAYLDTGALYRCTAIFLEDFVQNSNNDVLERELRNLKIDISLDPVDQWINLQDKDVTKEIRSLRVSEISSLVSANPIVRKTLLEVQRKLIKSAEAEKNGIVVEGRDIGTVVMPDAEYKFYLTADEDVRAKRRGAEIGEAFDHVKHHLSERDNRDINRSTSPLTAASDAITVDTTHLSLDQVVNQILDLISREVDEVGSIEPDDVNSLGSSEFQPVVAVIGRPNVGKSTLVNRLIGQRSAVTEDTPGVTRDRVAYESEWNSKKFTLVDTGGWDSKATGLYEQVARQAEFAITAADLCLLVIDATVGATDDDLLLIRKLRESKIPIILVANKVDSPKDESDASALWNLGLGEPFNISALHGRGAGDLLDLIVSKLPDESTKYQAHPTARSVAILGRPNVGKSSLLNNLVGSKRAVVSDVAGTTVDPIDEYIELDDREWIFIDTAGIRKKFKQDSGHEYYAVLRTQATIDRAEVVVVLIDASEELSDQDRRIINLAEEAGKAIIVCFNKWDLVDEDRRIQLDREIDTDLQQQRWIPKMNISASTGRGVQKLPALLTKVLENWDRRIPTSELNRLVKDFVMAHPHPLRGGRQAKILFATQVSTRPPTFAVFASRPLDDGYIRFLERTIRESFDFTGTPIRFKQRLRNTK